MIILQVLGTAILSSILTLAIVRWWLRRSGAPLWEQQIDALHESIARTVDIRVKRAIIESLSEAGQAEALRESSWKAARSGGDLISESLQALLGRKGRE
ncbi:MAG: hypothetical protein V4688_03035 [Pseudomonadota bacterium]